MRRTIYSIVILAITLSTISCNFFNFLQNKHHENKPFITSESLAEANSISSFETYSFEEHPFKNWSEAQITSLLGLSSMSLKDTSNISESTNFSISEDLPESFDSRDKWPECIHPIRNQGHCGSCWAHGASEVLSDRFCIASEGKINVVLSPQDMVSCDYFDMGCNGGILTASWLYLRMFGIVTDECKPYSSGDGKVESCPLFNSKCTNGSAVYKKYKAKNFYYLPTINQIKKNISEKGPIETGFSVYSDFLNYKGGVYKRSGDSKMLGGHAVKIIGWGKDGETEYWIVANSWSETWGEKGYFKIAFRECGIENVIAGDPSL